MGDNEPMTIAPPRSFIQPEDPWALNEEQVVADLRTDADLGLSSANAKDRLNELGPNELTSEPPPSIWQLAVQQLVDPMNLMLLAVAIVSVFIAQISTSILVGFLVFMNIVLGTRQELKARASIDALSQLQVPQAKVTRDGELQTVAATTIVPGDIVQVESGDIVPADGRLLRSATLEVQEAALTGESAPIGKSTDTLASPDVALGD